MSLNNSSARVRPHGGRDPEFAAAMARAEAAAEPRVPRPAADDPVARTRSGHVVRRDGSMFGPGVFFDRTVFNALPLE